MRRAIRTFTVLAMPNCQRCEKPVTVGEVPTVIVERVDLEKVLCVACGTRPGLTTWRLRGEAGEQVAVGVDFEAQPWWRCGNAFVFGPQKGAKRLAVDESRVRDVRNQRENYRRRTEAARLDRLAGGA